MESENLFLVFLHILDTSGDFPGEGIEVRFKRKKIEMTSRKQTGGHWGVLTLSTGLLLLVGQLAEDGWYQVCQSFVQVLLSLDLGPLKLVLDGLPILCGRADHFPLKGILPFFLWIRCFKIEPSVIEVPVSPALGIPPKRLDFL